MVINCLECRAKCGTPHTLSFHYKLKHKDKIGECKCGDLSLSRICSSKFIQEAYDPNHNYNFNPNSKSNPNSNPNSNLRSSFANSNPNYNTKSNPNSNLRSSFADLQSGFANLSLSLGP